MNISGANGNPMMQMGGGLPPPPPFPEMNVYGQELMNISDAQRMAAYMPNNMMMGPGSMVSEDDIFELLSLCCFYSFWDTHLTFFDHDVACFMFHVSCIWFDRCTVVLV